MRGPGARAPAVRAPARAQQQVSRRHPGRGRRKQAGSGGQVSCQRARPCAAMINGRSPVSAAGARPATKEAN